MDKASPDQVRAMLGMEVTTVPIAPPKAPAPEPEKTPLMPEVDPDTVLTPEKLCPDQGDTIVEGTPDV